MGGCPISSYPLGHEVGGHSYWGGALKQFDGNRFQTHEAKFGPISPFHYRACEVFAQLKGAGVDYSLDYSTADGHANAVCYAERLLQRL